MTRLSIPHNTGDDTISTHTLTWSVTVAFLFYGGGTMNFNSHAHVERDVAEKEYPACTQNFNSHAHVERDTYSIDYIAII